MPTLDFVVRQKAFVLGMFLMLLSAGYAYGQSCSCPPIATCGCNVGLTKLKVQFNGLLGLTVDVRDAGGNLFTGLVLLPGSTFEVESSAGTGQPFVGDLVTIRTTLLVVAQINTSCTTPVTIGTTFGSFTVIDGESVGAKPICCDVMETTPPVISGCPANINVPANATSCGAIVNWTAPTVNDNCAIASFSSNHNPGAFFPVGITPVTYTATDNYGNVATCSFTVTVTDNAIPVFTGCPANMIVPVDAATCTAVATWVEPTVSDNCNATPFVARSNSPGETFALGVHTITYAADDTNGNIGICSFTVTVVDNTKPVFAGCPSDIIVPVTPTTCNAVVNWVEPTASDHCDATPTLSKSNSPGETFTAGVHTINYFAVDDSGNQQTCSFTITVVDDTKPVFAGCPSNMIVPVNPATCDVVVNWVEPTASDNCDTTPTLSKSNSPGEAFALGVHTVNYFADDDSGNRETCSFTITVIDNTAPVFAACPGNMIVSVNPLTCDAVVNWIEPTASDNCDTTPTVLKSNSPGQTFTLGVHTVNYFADDDSGNRGTCSFTITVIDDTQPTFTGCPANIVVSADPVTCNAVVNWISPTATDNCDATPTLSSTHNPGATFAPGVYTVSYFADDDSGNRGTCSFTVTVTDDTDPVFANCPTNLVVPVNAATCDAVVNWVEPTATDNCDATPTITRSNSPGETFGLGSHTITYFADDDSGNRATCSFTITIIDTTKPVFNSCPANIIASVNPTTCNAVVNWTLPTAADKCDTSPTVTSMNSPGETFALGMHTITYVATDASGNQESCSFTITVIDDTNPVFAGCPANIIVPVDAATCTAVATWIEPTATDNCDTTPTLTRSNNPGATFALGAHTITYTAEDDSGNKSTCSFTVTVIDNTSPVLANCPSDFTVSVNPATCNAIVNWTAPTATDNCDTTPTITSSNNPGATLALGSHTITYSVEDDSGNKNTCSFIVTVIDDTAPTLTGCPANIMVSSDLALCGTTVTWTPPTVSDNCTTTTTLTSNFNSGDFFPLGTTTVTYKAQDGAGNFAAECSFTVTVTDNTLPSIAGCPSDISITADAACVAIATWTEPTTSDNCGATLTSDHAAGEVFALGTTTVTYTAKDNAGNMATCSFDVIVKDDTDPVFANCPANIVASADPTACGVNVSWSKPTVSDNCANTITATSTHNPGDFFAVGTATTVTYSATDGAGNTATCSFTVTVGDAVTPVFQNCPTNISIPSDASCGAIANWAAPIATDNCGIASVSSSHQPGERFEIGITAVEYIATDVHGNVSFCRFTVTVRNEDTPFVTGCPQDVLARAGESGETEVTWTPPTASTRCGDLTFVGSHQPGDVFAVGTTKVNYVATNDVGNSVTCSFNVVVRYKDLAFDVTKVVTPDGDGINDEWIVSNIENFNRNKVMITDRWGSVIFQASGYNNSNVVWKGVNGDGAQVPTGTYYYFIEVHFLEQQLKKSGFIELVR
ncbi:HYR domain-containing protein [Chryseolinea lacunae]|uniref:HYR domain-containing protein n=1 Tax=Chryseolinea lacunae TaxID=2801331 RepID=A0ABS1KPP3_9BACT|nr:HYR domain-containing protein [Chryseolinea lacunae]MBL0741434.1 HYR domain-containing protein [Chryseolinea lacunae]